MPQFLFAPVPCGSQEPPPEILESPSALPFLSSPLTQNPAPLIRLALFLRIDSLSCAKSLSYAASLTHPRLDVPTLLPLLSFLFSDRSILTHPPSAPGQG